MMQTKAPFLALALACVACGSTTEPVAQPRAVNVKVSGHVAVMDIPPAATDDDFQNLSVHVLSPAELLVKPTQTSPLAGAELDTTHEACTMRACPFAIDDVNVFNAGMGLVAQVRDETKALRWIPAFTGIASPAAAQHSKATHAPLENNLVYALTAASFQTVATSLGLSPDELQQKGLLIGMATRPLAEAVNGVSPGMAGVKVKSVKKNTKRTTFLYPSDDYKTTSSDAGTNRDGVFYGVGDGLGTPFTTTLEFENVEGGPAIKAEMAGLGAGLTMITAYPAQ